MAASGYRGRRLHVVSSDVRCNCGSNFEANMAEIEARLVGMIQAPARKFTQFRMKNFKNRHSFFGKSFLFFFLLCVKSGFITPPGN